MYLHLYSNNDRFNSIFIRKSLNFTPNRGVSTPPRFAFGSARRRSTPAGRIVKPGKILFQIKQNSHKDYFFNWIACIQKAAIWSFFKFKGTSSKTLYLKFYFFDRFSENLFKIGLNFFQKRYYWIFILWVHSILNSLQKIGKDAIKRSKVISW